MSDLKNEAPGSEVEAKLAIPNLTSSPTQRLLDVMDTVYQGKFPGWQVLPTKGAVEAIRTWRLDIGAWGVRNDEEFTQHIMLVERPDGKKMVNQKKTILNLGASHQEAQVLTRPENKAHCTEWLDSNEFIPAWEEMLQKYPGLHEFGQYLRTKAAFQVISPLNRVFTISIDYSLSEGLQPLTQMEIEYKHTIGEADSQIEGIVSELKILSTFMEEIFGFTPYSLTKLEWLLTPRFQAGLSLRDFS